MPHPLLHAQNLHKSFILHTQGGIRLPVLEGVALKVYPGECVALSGPSGSGKSTLMRCLYANYRVDQGSILIHHRGEYLDLTQAAPHEVLEIRRETVGYVSQFLRVIPRVPALQVAAEPLLELGVDPVLAQTKVAHLFSRLNLPERLWSVSPTTFSGGEKQRVNIARAFLGDETILLLDEPTSALDTKNRQVVVELIQERLAAGGALVGIFHDEEVKQKVSTRELRFGDP